MLTLKTAAGLALALAVAAPAAAQSSSGMQGGGSMPGMSRSQNMGGMKGMEGMSPMQHEMMMAMQRMDQDMMAAEDSNPDRAFAKKMMAHHQGAIAMSEIEVRYGKDAEAKRLARKTIKENGRGVSELKAFLARH